MKKELIVERLSKKYLKKIFTNFNYTFQENTIYGIIGPSGCGKSTLLSILSGTITRYKGNVFYNQINIQKQKNYTFLRVGYVYQNNQLFDNLTAYENVILPLEMIKKDIRKVKFKIHFLFKYFHIESTINQKVKNLSGGEKQRIAIIRALIKNPDILLFDEPTSALDNENMQCFFEYLKKIQSNKIIIIVTHNQQLAEMCDQIIDFSHLKEHKVNNVNERKYQEKKLKFYKMKWLHKKVFTGKKIFNYLSTSILSLGLIGICLTQILTSFISNVLKQSFFAFNTLNCATFKSISSHEEIDFSNILQDQYESLYYEGIEPTLKKQFKESQWIQQIKFNNYKIEDTQFVYDNYLSMYSENIVLSIPKSAILFLQDKNNLQITTNYFSFYISIDKVVESMDQNFYIHCNHVSYLNPLMRYFNQNMVVSQYIYSRQSRKLYEYLIHDFQFKDYNFYLDQDNQMIFVQKSIYPRIDKSMINEILSQNKYLYCIFSDFTHTLIDYDTGFIYLLLENKEAIQVIMDEAIQNDTIYISSKLAKTMSNTHSFLFYNKELKIQKIIKENNYGIIYMNSSTYNSLNGPLLYSCMIQFYQPLQKSNFTQVLMNQKLFNSSSFHVFHYIIDFLRLFSLILIVESFFASLFIFAINFLNKKKEVICLLKLGMYKSKILYLLLMDPFTNLISALISSLCSAFLSKIMMITIYNYLQNVELEITFSITFIFFIILLPFLLMIPPILLKIKCFFKKFDEK